MAIKSIRVSRAQVLAFRQEVGHLAERLPLHAAALREVAWAGLQDSSPRAALLSLHARIEGVTPGLLASPRLCQIWGPRYSAYVVASRDVSAFTLGRLPADARGRARALTAAARIAGYLRGGRMPYGRVGRALRMVPNSLRYAATTGSIRMLWDGAAQPVIWHTRAPEVDPLQACRDLLLRYFHVFGPSTMSAFVRWAGIASALGERAHAAEKSGLVEVLTPGGTALVLDSDREALRRCGPMKSCARLLPSGDAYYLCWGLDRELLVPDPRHRRQLWTSRVWPGAVLLDGEIVGTWRRDSRDVTLSCWRRLGKRQRQMLEVEAASLPVMRSGNQPSIRLRIQQPVVTVLITGGTSRVTTSV